MPENSKLSPELTAAQRFLDLLENDGKFTFLAFSERNKEKGYPCELHGTLAENAERMTELNMNGHGIFVTINRTNLMGRKSSDITGVRAHFIDSDEEPIEAVCSRLPLKPHMMIETSEGKGHAYYLTSDTTLGEFQDIQMRLIDLLGTDKSIKDLSRTMRLPGFYHMKGEPKLVKIIHVEEGLPPYSKAELLAALPTSSPVVRDEKRNTKKANPTVPLSDGFRTEALGSLVGQLISKGISDEEILPWISLWNRNNTPALPNDKLLETIRSIRKTDQRNHPERYGAELAYTDAGNAQRLVSNFGDDIRYAHDRAQWLIWDSQRWCWDTTDEIMRKATETAYKISTETESVDDPSKIQKIWKWANASLSKSAIKAMIDLAKSHISTSTTTDRLDCNDWLFNVANGTIDLRANQFRCQRREDLITRMAPVVYDPGAACPRWEDFLHYIFDDDQELIGWVQKLFGYCLTGDISEQMMVFLIGDGCNGKSTLLNVMKQIMGDYAVQSQPEIIMQRRYNDAGGARSDLMRLQGARMVVATEGDEGQKIAEGFVKQMTGGEEISTRGLYQKNQVEFKPNLKLLFCSNHKPVIRGADKGIWRRFRVVPFKVQIPEEKRDPHMLEKLLGEKSGILNWALEGCREWQEVGLGVTSAVSEATAIYKDENDVVGRFIEDCCSTGSKIQSSRLYEEYRKWCLDTGEEIRIAQSFSAILKSKGFESKKLSNANYWLGLDLRSDVSEFAAAA